MENNVNDGAAELQALIESEIPEGRSNLENSYANLERVAAYCEANYLQAADKKAAFEETRRYTIQSLASVAYQINTLAYSLMQMMDLQSDKITDMVSEVNNLAQIVDIHKEKVARREIGVLTSTKVVVRKHKIIAPLTQEKPRRYTRQEIDYSVLDDIGHGVKLPSLQPSALHPSQQLLRTASTASGGSSGSVGSHQPQFMMQQQNATLGRAMAKGSLSKGTSGKEQHYRSPMTISSPMPPQQQQVQYGTLQRNNVVVNQQQTQQQYLGNGQPIYRIPQVSMAGNPYGSVGYGQTARSNLPIDAYGQMTQPAPMQPLPPPQLASVADYRLSSQTNSADDQLPPPPSPNVFDVSYGAAQHSPPLPPPPMPDECVPSQTYGSVQRSSRPPVPEWVPHNFIEKVIAIYDYQAEKEDELTFSENSVIFVLRKNEDGWFEGVCDGVTGLFPGNYVEPCL